MRTRDESKEASIKARAMEMIVREGFEGLSMQKLAKAAGVSPATIYIYWKNREDLLNQLFREVQATFADLALEGFSPDLPLREGLWLQWQNRVRFIRLYPTQFAFYEHFRHSPLIQRCNARFALFKDTMRQFLEHAIERGEMRPMPAEVFWSLAYAPLYSLVNFHSNRNSCLSNNFQLDEATLELSFDMVIQSLRPHLQTSSSSLPIV